VAYGRHQLPPENLAMAKVKWPIHNPVGRFNGRPLAIIALRPDVENDFIAFVIS
jgi:hypothetical protein